MHTTTMFIIQLCFINELLHFEVFVVNLISHCQTAFPIFVLCGREKGSGDMVSTSLRSVLIGVKCIMLTQRIDLF